ncbi:type I restriction endonuclease subunit R [Streptomyces mirabilis]|uniref:type I restriction endonuclease subunit R n=1 Tax=Streptomyces mirabilis TaxID=68239 RepID=UPI001BAEF57E|nr:type I restriction endonuclease [Streptomyces mirabilis]QUW79437.1 type I restriction endonuclease subunit R [Streptomyces mirabilis]
MARALPEYEKTEQPLIEQLVALRWEHLQGAPPGSPATDPAASERQTFTETVYPERFKKAVSRINPGADGRPWLDAAQLDALLALVLGTSRGHGHAEPGVAGNLQVTRLLREGVNARTLVGWEEGDPEFVRLVDWDGTFGPEDGEAEGDGRGGNDWLAVSQFRVERAGVGPATPDLVLFVNGLPWAVVECKAPLTSGSDSRAALDAAVAQVLGYAGAYAAAPVPAFTRFAQLLVATDRDHAELGTVTADPEYFTPWRTTAPAPAAGCGNDMAVLAVGVLTPRHFLALVRDFTTERLQGGRTVKVIGRYQQFRAVTSLARRLRERQKAIASGHAPNHRGGVVWHTQGSGKSLTMAFLVRHLRSDPELRTHKVVVVTDRRDLEKQISRSLAAAEETVHRATSVPDARAQLGVDVPDIVLVMLQKARRDDSADDGTEETLGSDDESPRLHNVPANESSRIVVLVDEAHRGQDSWLHARLRRMLPNAVLIGFTGTPIIDDTRKKTEQIFGDLADTYTLRDAERDGSVVPVRYEAWDVPLEVVEKAVLDARFDERVPSDPDQRRRVLRKFARRKEIQEAPVVIAAKAEHMLRHWAVNALPDRFGAQVVAVSRRAAVSYRDALLAARDRLLAEVDALDPDLVHDPNAAFDADEPTRELLTIQRQRELLRSIDAAVVISERSPTSPGSDPESWRRWKLKSRQDAYIERFLQGLGDPLAAADDPSWYADAHGPAGQGLDGDGDTTGGDEWHVPGTGDGPPDPDDSGAADQESGEEPLAFLVVQSMLLTGFDAPVEQVLYLDRAISGVNLLQAVARTNRPYPKKEWGLVVDYAGVGPELARLLRAYDQRHLREVYGYERVDVDHLKRDDEGRYPDDQPTGDGLLLQADAAADRLLTDLHDALFRFLDGQGLAVRDLDGIVTLDDEGRREDLLDALRDPITRGEFDELVRDFLSALGAVLPRPAALPYERLAGHLGEVQYLVRRRYLDGRDEFSPRRYGAKVRQLIAQHLRANDAELRVPRVDLSDPEFMERVNANPDTRARIAYMESSLRTRITARLAGDRATYDRFSERLDAIVRQMRDDSEQAAADLVRLVGDVNAAEAEAGSADAAAGLDPLTEGPVCRALAKALEEAGMLPLPPTEELHQAVRVITSQIVDLVRMPSFTTSNATRIDARKTLRRTVEVRLGMQWEDTAEVATELVRLAEARRQDFLLRGDRPPRP